MKKRYCKRKRRPPALDRGEVVNVLLEKNPGIVSRYKETRESSKVTIFPEWSELDDFFFVLPEYLSEYLGSGFQSGGSSKEVKVFFESIEELEPSISKETFETLILGVLVRMKIEMYIFVPMYAHHLPPKVRKYVQSLDPLSFIDMYDLDE